MPRFEDNILGFIPKKDWLDVGTLVARPNDPVDQLIDDQKTDNLVAEWESLAAEYQIPMMAQFHGFDTEAQTTIRMPIDSHNIEKGLIKVKINQSERLRALIGRGVQNESQLYDYVIRDGVRLADQVVTRSKVAKNEMLATGKITIKENNLNMTVDYGVPSANTSLTIDTSASADIPAQIQTIIDAAKAKGKIITGMYTSGAILTKMRNNTAMQKLINGNYGTGALIRNQALREFLGDEFGLNTIITNDLTYALPARIGSNGRPQITAKRYFPKDKITFFVTNPAGRLARGLWGDPPELDVARFGNMDVSGATNSPYVTISQWTEKDPAVLWTKASALFMPVLFDPESLYIATEQ